MELTLSSPDDVAVLEIGAAGFPFGSGAHECPGRAVAESLVAGVADALAAAGYVVDATRTVVDTDGRPTTLVATREDP